MMPLSERCSFLREEAIRHSNQEHFRAQPWVYLNIGWAKAFEDGLYNSEIVASGLASIIRNMTPWIAPRELLVGFNYGDGPMKECCEPKNTTEWRRIMAQSHIPEEKIQEYLHIIDSGKGTFHITLNYVLTPSELDMQDDRSGIGRIIDHSHTVLGYEQVLKLGFSGLLEKVEKYERLNGSNPVYRSMKILCTAACEMGLRYADKAKELLESGRGEYDPEDLRSIIETCTQVPAKPARSFCEALQALWFAHILNTWEDGINANSLGRLDQILYPYYVEDIRRGVLTMEKAFELICCLWIKLYRDYDVQQSCVGGTDADGKSQVNELSYLMLDATEQLNFIRCLSVRFGRNTEPEFLKRALEVVGHVQKGVPFFFNDEVMIPALMYKGIPREDACGYTELGCVETTIPGKANPHAVTGETNLLKAVEYVLCNGSSMMFPEKAPGVKTGGPEKLDSFEKFYHAILVQIARILNVTCRVVAEFRPDAVHNSQCPVKSLLTEGCIESGRDFNDGGAKYDYYQIMIGGIPNLADSLMVIKKFVYEDRLLTLSELRCILEENYPNEAIRQMFLNKAPKFGNDDDEVDTLATSLLNFCCDELDELSEKYSLSFHAQPFTFKWMIDDGFASAASPDGRRAGEPTAYSCSPMQGRDFLGLTALLNSLSKLPTTRTPGTTSAIVEVDPKLFCDSNIDILTDILIAAGNKGLSNVQFNTVSAKTLIDAQKYPDKYNNLAVRVCGFSQKFNLLTPELQDHIIGRTKHTCL